MIVTASNPSSASDDLSVQKPSEYQHRVILVSRFSLLKPYLVFSSSRAFLQHWLLLEVRHNKLQKLLYFNDTVLYSNVQPWKN